jgi:hypothetical protein
MAVGPNNHCAPIQIGDAFNNKIFRGAAFQAVALSRRASTKRPPRYAGLDEGCSAIMEIMEGCG